MTILDNTTNLQSILDAVNALPEAGSGLDTSDATAAAGDIREGQTAYVDGEKVTGTLAEVEQAELDILISSAGLITAEATQVAGIVANGYRVTTKQLPSIAGKTVTPGTSNQTAVAAGRYTTGAVIVQGDANLVPENIAEGVSIFGVEGTHSGGSGDADEWEAEFASLIETGNCTKLPDSVTSIGSYAFAYCTNLALAELPSGITSIGSYAFYRGGNLTLTKLPDGLTKIEPRTFDGCKKMVLTRLPDGVTSIGEFAFSSAVKTAFIELPTGLTSIGRYGLYECKEMTITSVPEGVTTLRDHVFSYCVGLTDLETSAESIESCAFYGCTNLASLRLNASSVCTLSSTDVFSNTPIASGTGYVYVPDSLVDSYKAATNWSTYASQIKPLSEYEGASV